MLHNNDHREGGYSNAEAIALIQKQNVPVTVSRSLMMLDESALNSLVHEISPLLEIDQDEIILAPGRSPALHAIALKEFRVDVYSFAYSGCAYVYDDPTIDQISAMRKRLRSIGLTPEKLLNTRHINIFDYLDFGRVVISLVCLFSHWLHDINMGKATAAVEWYNAPNRIDLSLIFQKIKLYTMSSFNGKQVFKRFPELPLLKTLPLVELKIRNVIYYYYNALYVPLPYFPPECWEVTAPLEEISPNYYMKAFEQQKRIQAAAKNLIDNRKLVLTVKALISDSTSRLFQLSSHFLEPYVATIVPSASALKK